MYLGSWKAFLGGPKKAVFIRKRTIDTQESENSRGVLVGCYLLSTYKMVFKNVWKLITIPFPVVKFQDSVGMAKIKND